MNKRPSSLPGTPRRFAARGQAGSTLIETLVGTAIAAIGISGLCVANANCLGMARAHKEVLLADQCLQQRAEQYRSSSWSQITDPTSIVNLLNVTPVDSTTPLNGQVETITVTPYPAVTPAVTPLVVTRDATGATTVVSQPQGGFYLRNSLSVQAAFQETWTSAQGTRPRQRSTSVVIAFGGLL